MKSILDHISVIDKAEAVRVMVALGSNAPGRSGPPWEAMARAVEEVHMLPGVRVAALSGLWRSAPWGRLRQPPFFNAVMVLETHMQTHALLRALLALETRLGRRRGMRAWGPRTLDLDLLDHGGRVMRPVGMGRKGSARAKRFWQGKGMILPHPGLHERAFVLLPLAEVAPQWRHPLLGANVRALLARLPWRVRAQCRAERFGRAAAAWLALRSRNRSQSFVNVGE